MALSQLEAQQTVEEHGSQAAAARALGVGRSTFRYWLDPESWLERRRREYRADPEAKKARSQEDYYSMSGLHYARKLLKNRRYQALRRMEKRNRTKGVI